MTVTAIALKSIARTGQGPYPVLPVFHVLDDIGIETRECKSRLEREMRLKAFKKSEINAALGIHSAL